MRLSSLLIAGLVAAPLLAQGDASGLSFRDALARGRQSAVLTAAEAGVTEARANLRAESRWLRVNPDVEIDAGPRRTATRTTTQHTTSIEQPLEIGGRRGARIARAQADLAAAVAERDSTVVQYLRDVALAYVNAADSQARVRLAKENEAIAVELVHIAERRFAVGDIPVLDVNVAKAALSQARSDVLAAEGTEEQSTAILKARLLMPRTAPLKTTDDLASAIAVPDLAALTDRASNTPEIRSLEAQLQQAEADIRLARSLSWPDLTIRGEHSIEEDSRILLGGVRFSLPIFNRGQGELAAAEARQRRAQLQLGIAQETAMAEATGLFAQYVRQRAAADELRLNAIPLLADNVHLTTRSYEVGEIDLAEVLIIKRDTLDARTRYLDRVRDAAETAVELETRAGFLAP